MAPSRRILELSAAPSVDSLTSLGPPPREVDKGTALGTAASDAVPSRLRAGVGVALPNRTGRKRQGVESRAAGLTCRASASVVVRLGCGAALPFREGSKAGKGAWARKGLQTAPASTGTTPPGRRFADPAGKTQGPTGIGTARLFHPVLQRACSLRIKRRSWGGENSHPTASAGDGRTDPLAKPPTGPRPTGRFATQT